MARPLPPAESLNLVPLADIARGGMGSVQLCRVEGGSLAGRVLAVKRLNPELEQDPQFVNMFIDETWMTAAIASPNVIGVVAWGQDSLGHYLAVELVQGVSLSRLVKESRAKKEPFSERTVACILSQIGAGLEAAHMLKDERGASMNLVHRDLTPGNILVGFDGVVKIADFGIAKANARLTETTAGTMKGKPSYMAPEQARGTPVDARADLFSLGVMAYELLGGTRPWVGGNDLEILVAVNTVEPIDLGELRQVDPVFLEITRGCLQKDRDKRFGSAAEIRQKLDAWRTARGYVQDDLTSLGAFVGRNTQRQLEWFERALAGVQRDGATFKDVEEQIDKARKPSRSEDPRLKSQRGPDSMPLRPGTAPMPPPSGRGAQPSLGHPGALPLTVPMSAQMGAPGQHLAPRASPALGAPRQDQHVDDLAATRMVDDLAATRMVDDLSATRPIELRKPVVMSLGGTIAYSAEEMAALSKRGPGPPRSVPEPPIPSPSSSSRAVQGLTPPPPRAAATMAWPYQANAPVTQPSPQSGPTSQPHSSGPASPRHQPLGTGLALPPQGFGGGAGAPESVRQPAHRRSVLMPILLIVVFVLVAGAVGAYFMRARLGF